MHLIVGLTEDIEVIPGTEQSLNSIAVQNKSATDNIYAFIEFDFNPYAFEIADVSGWEVIENGNGRVLYSYSSDGMMDEVDINEFAAFSGTLRCISDFDTFQALEDEDFVVDVMGYAIITDICSSGNDDAWADYQAGGKQ